MDLPGGDPAEHWESLQRVVPGFKDTDMIYPAHDYRNLTESTIGVERATNPNLIPRNKEGYLKWMGSMAQPTPEWMVKTVQANLEGTTDPKVDWIPADAACMSMCSPVVGGSSLESVPEVSPEEVHSRHRAADPPLLLDVREADEYSGPLGHLPGSMLVPLGELPERLAELDSHRARSIITLSSERPVAEALAAPATGLPLSARPRRSTILLDPRRASSTWKARLPFQASSTRTSISWASVSARCGWISLALAARGRSSRK